MHCTGWILWALMARCGNAGMHITMHTVIYPAMISIFHALPWFVWYPMRHSILCIASRDTMRYSFISSIHFTGFSGATYRMLFLIISYFIFLIRIAYVSCFRK